MPAAATRRPRPVLRTSGRLLRTSAVHPKNADPGALLPSSSHCVLIIRKRNRSPMDPGADPPVDLPERSSPKARDHGCDQGHEVLGGVPGRAGQAARRTGRLRPGRGGTQRGRAVRGHDAPGDPLHPGTSAARAPRGTRDPGTAGVPAKPPAPRYDQGSSLGRMLSCPQLPPTIKQRIRAEAHGASPTSRTRLANGVEPLSTLPVEAALHSGRPGDARGHPGGPPPRTRRLRALTRGPKDAARKTSSKEAEQHASSTPK